MRVGRQRYAIDISCTATALAAETDAAAEPRLEFPQTDQVPATAAAGEAGRPIDGWRVCWLGGRDRRAVRVNLPGETESDIGC